MKNQNPKSRLLFNKTIIAELNENQLMQINGGAATSIDWPSTGCLCTLVTRTIQQIAQ